MLLHVALELVGLSILRNPLGPPPITTDAIAGVPAVVFPSMSLQALLAAEQVGTQVTLAKGHASPQCPATEAAAIWVVEVDAVPIHLNVP